MKSSNYKYITKIILDKILLYFIYLNIKKNKYYPKLYNDKL